MRLITALIGLLQIGLAHTKGSKGGSKSAEPMEDMKMKDLCKLRKELREDPSDVITRATQNDDHDEYLGVVLGEIVPLGREILRRGDLGEDSEFCKPECKQSIEFDADHKSMLRVGAADCDAANTLTLLDVAGRDKLEEFVATFPSEFTQLTSQQFECIKDENTWANGTAKEGDWKTYSASVNEFLTRFTNEDPDYRLLMSVGLFWDSTDGVVRPNCGSETPNGPFGHDLAVGHLDELWHECGVEYPLHETLNIGVDFKAERMRAGICSYWGGGTLETCYGKMYEPMGGGGVAVRCMLVGGAYNFHVKMLWNMGGIDLAGKLPGCRVFCPKATKESKCENLCTVEEDLQLICEAEEAKGNVPCYCEDPMTCSDPPHNWP